MALTSLISFISQSFAYVSALILGWFGKPFRRIEKQARALFIEICKQGPIPKHVAFIMDGNRRFAKKNGYERTVEGHSAGFEGLQQTMEWCYELGIRTVTVYAFSIENFNRSPEEVSTLMSLAMEKFQQMTSQSDLVKRYGVRIRVIGELEMLPEDVREAVQRAMNMTKDNSGPTINICFPYTAKAELITAANKALSLPDHDEIDISAFRSLLYTGCCDPVDILVRTSGEHRLSEFLNWQMVDGDGQVEFLNVLWPDFRFWHFLPILGRYQLRNCKYGSL